MQSRRRTILAALLGPSLAAMAAAELQAQETNTVGPAVLRDYRLPGERTTLPPVRPAPTPAPTPPPAPAATAAPRGTPPPAARTPARPTTAAPARTAQPTRTVDAQVQTQVPLQEQPQVPLGKAAGPPPPAESGAPAAQPAATSPEPDSGFPWPYMAGGLLLALLAAAALRSRRRPGEAGQEAVAEGPAPRPAVPKAEPQPAAPPPRPAGRPWLELEFKPGKAAATDAQAQVEFELRIKNVGTSAAENVLIEARMFNAGAQQDREIGGFFSAPDPSKAARSPRSIPPGGTATFRSVVAMPKESVREVVIEGRRLFIPMVAFNVLYRWGAGAAGQNSMSYLVGRETQPPAEKMAPFRLDLGPRIYRSVGFRPNKLAMNV